jgi:hypothetical protein
MTSSNVDASAFGASPGSVAIAFFSSMACRAGAADLAFRTRRGPVNDIKGK